MDPEAREVTVRSGETLYAHAYDKLVLAPGIEFIPPPGSANPDPAPHAWRAGPQTQLLKNRQQAKVCADAILRCFRGEIPDPAPVTSSACFSPITSSKASWLTASFSTTQPPPP